MFNFSFLHNICIQFVFLMLLAQCLSAVHCINSSLIDLNRNS